MAKQPMKPIDIDDELKGLPIDEDMETVESQILSEFETDPTDIWKIFVYRVGTGGKQGPRLFECSVADLPIIPRVRAEYGSGDYSVVIQRNGRIFRRLTFSLEVPKKPEPQNSGELSAIAAAMQNQTRMIEGLLNRITQTPIAPPQNNIGETIAMFTQLAGAMKSLMPSSGPAQTEPSIGARDLMDMFSKGMEMAKEFAVSEKGESNLIDLVRDALKSPLVENILKAQQIASRQMTLPLPLPPGRPQSPQVMPGITPQTPAQPVTENVNNQLSQANMLQIAGFVNVLVNAAKMRADVGTYSDLIAEQLDDELINNILNMPNLRDRLAEINPGVVPNWPWFELLLADLRETMADSIVPENNSSETGANVNNPDIYGTHPGNADVYSIGEGGDESNT